MGPLGRRCNRGNRLAGRLLYCQAPFMPVARTTAQKRPGAFWYRQEKGQAHADVAAMVERISENQATVREDLLRYWRLYEDVPILGFGAYSYARSMPGDALPSMSLNVTRSCVDTVAARICKNEIRPYMLPNGASWDVQQRAKAQ